VTDKAQSDFEKWYDGKDEDTQELIDAISERTYYITDEEEYDEFISELESEGITTADEFQDRFETEVESESDLYDWVEQLMDDSMYLHDVPDFIKNHIDWESVWNCEMRHDYVTIEFVSKSYVFNNCC
jgi:hypothetical protein